MNPIGTSSAIRSMIDLKIGTNLCSSQVRGDFHATGSWRYKFRPKGPGILHIVRCRFVGLQRSWTPPERVGCIQCKEVGIADIVLHVIHHNRYAVHTQVDGIRLIASRVDGICREGVK